MPERQFGVGDLVLARWPGSHLFFEGEVEDFNDIEYLVKFDDPDESKLAIKYKDVQRRRANSRGRSPGRASKSPGRTNKSPGRTSKSTGRPSKSPGRTSKSPGRPKAKSPARTTSPARAKSPTKATRKSPSRISTKQEETKADVSITSSKDNKSPPSSAANATTISSSSSSSIFSSVSSRSSLESHSKKPSVMQTSSILSNTTPLRQSARIATMDKLQNNDVKSSTSTTITRTTTSSSGSGKSMMCAASGCLKSAGGGLMWALTQLCSVLVPALKTLPVIAYFTMAPLIMTQACTKKKCTVLEFPDLPSKIESYYDPRAVLLVLSAFSLHFLLSFIPIKSRVLPNGAKARGNGIVTLLLGCLVIPAAVYLKYNVLLVYTMVRQLLATHTVLAAVLAILLYIKSHYAPRSQRNPRTVGHFLPDFVEGREVAPRLGSVDLKSLFMRYCFSCTVVFNIVLIMRDVQLNKGVYSPVLILVCAFQMIYCLDFLWFEESLYTTWEYSHHGTGLMVTLLYFTLPFYIAVISRAVLNYRTVLSWYCLVGISLLFLTGYVLMRAANNQKNAFRTNPSSPRLAHLESVPTSAGTRLLVGGWWGVIRHPNYVGEILMQVAAALLCGFERALPWVLVGVSVLSLIFRVYEVEDACKRKYGLSWSNYAGRVKYRLIPKVY